MQLGMDILKFLFFPGLIFMAACGGLLLYLEGWLQAAFYGGNGPRWRHAASGEMAKESATAPELAALAIILVAMGLSGVLLVGARGDLFILVLLFSAVEVLPLYLVAAGGVEKALFVPLLFRTAMCRMVALICIALSISLRFPGAFSPGLETLQGEGAPFAAQLWNGAAFAFIAASLASAGLAYLFFLLGRPVDTGRHGVQEEGARAAFRTAATQGPHRAASILLCALLFLGYPWEGLTGVLLWSASTAGIALAATAVRTWAEGRGGVFVRRLQGAAAASALLSVALAFTAVILNGSWS